MAPLTTTVAESESFLAEYDVLGRIPWLRAQLFGNSLHAYILTAMTYAVLWIGLSVLRRYVIVRLEKAGKGESARTVGFVRGLVKEIHPAVLSLVAFFIATKRLDMPETLEKGFHILTLSVVTVQIIRLTSRLIQYLIMPDKTRASDLAAKSTSNNIAALVEVALWTGGILFLLDNAGFNVSTFVAGLGIGGVAIALAAQAVLGDTFSSFAIALDKPFEVGDYINVDALQGTVEHIGLKTTRVRSVGGELLVFANSDLTRSRIKNFKRMYNRRGTFKLNIHPSTPLAKVKKIPDILAKCVEAQPETTLDRANFMQFGDSGLIFEVVYAVKRPDYKLYVDTQQAINLQIVEMFGKEGIQMAYAPPLALLDPPKA